MLSIGLIRKTKHDWLYICIRSPTPCHTLIHQTIITKLSIPPSIFCSGNRCRFDDNTPWFRQWVECRKRNWLLHWSMISLDWLWITIEYSLSISSNYRRPVRDFIQVIFLEKVNYQININNKSDYWKYTRLW